MRTICSDDEEEWNEKDEESDVRNNGTNLRMSNTKELILK